MFSIIAHFQTEENYGAHDWDGEGACPQYWKFKGGPSHELVSGLTIDQIVDLVQDKKSMDSRVAAMAAEFCEDNEYYRQYMLDWEFVDMSDAVLAPVVNDPYMYRDDLRYNGFLVRKDGTRGCWYVKKANA